MSLRDFECKLMRERERKIKRERERGRRVGWGGQLVYLLS
jgi:hypothetical protein